MISNSNTVKISVFFLFFIIANINLLFLLYKVGETGFEWFFMAATPLILFYFAIMISREFKISKIKSWPYVRGSINEVFEKHSSIKGLMYAFSFDYKVNDIQYNGSNFSYSDKFVGKGFIGMHPSFRSYTRIEDIIGNVVRVYYNPKTRHEAYLVNEYTDDVFVKRLDELGFAYSILMTVQMYFSAIG